MIKQSLAVLALILSTSVFAVGIGNDNPPSGGGGITTNTNNNQQQQGQAQGQIQGQLQGQGQSQGNVNVVAPVQNTTVNVKPVIDNNARARADSYSLSNAHSRSQPLIHHWYLPLARLLQTQPRPL